MSLFIGNLSRDVRAEDIEKAFEAYGKCKVDLRVHFRIRLVTIQRNYGFVEFENETEAEEAKSKLQRTNIAGSEINIEWSKKSGKANSQEGNRPRRR